jgi:hypothetical protein
LQEILLMHASLRQRRSAPLAIMLVLTIAGPALSTETSPAPEIPIDRDTTILQKTKVYAEPSEGAPAIAQVRSGVGVRVVAAIPENGWLKIELPDGKIAFAPSAVFAPSIIVGRPIVRDTATLVVAQRDIHLFGVQGEGGDFADGLQHFISDNGGMVVCERQDETHYVCTLSNSMDVAMAALLNGAARVTTDAPESYRDQQIKAQQKKRGIWGEE